jgi:GPH family glycoside/pentoside/hexuronide:cation symporter
VQTPPLSLSTKLFFGLGQAAEGIKSGTFNIFLFFYFNQVLGLSGSLAGLALLIAVVCDAITDPLAGSLSDSLRHRWGRRHPFMYASAVPLAVSFAILFRPPDGLDQLGLFSWLTIFTILVRSSMTLFQVPHMALGAELSQDYSERTTIVAFRTAFGLVGVVVVVWVAWTFFFYSTPVFENGQLNSAAYPPFGLLLAAVLLVSVVASSLGTHSRIPHLPRPAVEHERFSVDRLRRELAEALSNRSFRALFFGIVVFFVTRGVQETLGLHMSTYFWLLSPNEIQSVQLALAIGFIPGVPFWTLVSRRLDKKPTFLVSVSLFSVFSLIPPLAFIAGYFPDRASPLYLATLIITVVLAAFCAAGGIVTAGSMMADIADEHELLTGRRQEGIFFGALTFAGKSASGLGHGIAGLGIDWIEFPTRAVPGTVAAHKIVSLGILYGPGIAVLAVIAISLMTGYALDRERHAAIAKQLRELRHPE